MSVIQEQQQEEQQLSQAQQQSEEQQAANMRACPQCGRVFSRTAFVDHLFKNKDCMRRFWDDEEKDGAVKRRLRLQNARKAEAKVRQQQLVEQ
jgi:membrane protease subunit (stomatin/prohibitin family)